MTKTMQQHKKENNDNKGNKKKNMRENYTF